VPVTQGDVFQLEILKQSKFQVTLENIRGKQMTAAKICSSTYSHLLPCATQFASIQKEKHKK
jgi:hypothetical protein